MKLKVINIESEIRVFKPEEKWSLPKTCKLCQFEWQNIFNTMMWCDELKKVVVGFLFFLNTFFNLNSTSSSVMLITKTKENWWQLIPMCMTLLNQRDKIVNKTNVLE